MTDLERAVATMNRLWKDAQVMHEYAVNAEAEVARLTFLEYADRYPTKVKGFSFESEYQYDDEGGYFVSTSTYPLTTDCTSVELDDYELMDLLNGFTREALAMVCGVHGDSYQGECTVEQARERKF